MLDRTQAPAFVLPSSISLPEVESYRLANGIPVYILDAPHLDVVRIEIIFKAGKWYQSKEPIAQFTSRMLLEGTSTHSNIDISNYFSRLGAQVTVDSGYDRMLVTVFSLKRYISEVLELVYKLITDSTFNEASLDLQKSIVLQELKVKQEKTSYQASLLFREKLFGSTHPYASEANESGISALTRQELHDFAVSNLQSTNVECVISGAFGTSERDIFNRIFGQTEWNNQSGVVQKNHPSTVHIADSFYVEKKEAVQSSIRIGLPIVHAAHPDYFHLKILNEVLGGYFGSRLMSNIREDKGYTYGVHSYIQLHNHASYLLIGTDVKKENWEDAVREIKLELAKLSNEKIGEDELTTVRNYMIGSFCNSLNTAFDLADRYKAVHFLGLDLSHYSKYIDALKDVTADDLQRVAQQHLSTDSLTTVVVG